MRLGVDIGGTFTDFVLIDEAGRVRLHKRPTTPADPAAAVLAGVDALGFPSDPAAQVIHGSTIATNALLERRGARTALITTAGFADVLEIGRQNRPDLYALVPQRPPPLVPRQWRFELPERVSAQGEVLLPLDPAAVQALLARLQAEGIESVAVCFLFSYLYPGHERLVKEILEVGGERSEDSDLPVSTTHLYISISTDLLPEYREFERTATTVVNAYVTPLVDRYLDRLEGGLSPRPLRVMQSNGGAITAATARRQAARTALSGPAGGVVGAFAVANQALRLAASATPASPPGPLSPRSAAAFLPEATAPDIITFDMGGTSTDVCLCPGQVPFTAEGEIAALGLPLRLPIIDIHTVGAGGGSLARLDVGGALTVGPESAGAEPGPACYGHGGQLPTVTDANLVLGRLHPAHFLGGQLPLDPAAARAALAPLAVRLAGAGPGETLPLDALERAAWGVLQVANAAMERAIRKISIERGYDPADFTLVAFGGAGPLHACELAERLTIPRVLVPRAPGVLSALGMLVADLVKDYSITVLRLAAGLTAVELAALFAPWEAQAQAEMAAELGPSGPAVQLQRSADLRYEGQSFEITVPLPAGPPDPAALLADFHARHARRYGHSHPGAPVEVVNLRVRAVGPTPRLDFEPLPAAQVEPVPLPRQDVWFETAAGLVSLPTRLYAREALRAGHSVTGPALLVQLDATTVIAPGWSGSIDTAGHLLLSRSAGTPQTQAVAQETT
ncbi:MAG: hydantoinase/oxoprolinase family protein [Anaerolineales bacterium]|nr:hydantoinase/oxoprolinase family protein [Anaerolineales bacterium]